MKHMRLLKSLLVILVAIFGVNMAMAQELSFSVDKQFLTPGDKATITVNMTNTVTLTSFGGTIVLPEGLSFVQEDGSDEYVCSSINPDCDAVLAPSTNPQKAGFMVLNTEKQKPSSGAFFTFDVNVDANFASHTTILFSDLLGSIVTTNSDGVEEQVVLTDEDFNADVYNENNLVLPKVENINIAVGETKTVEFILDYNFLSCVEYRVAFPVGLTVSNYKVSSERAPEHRIKSEDDYIAVYPKFNAKNYSFLGETGAIITFDVTATEELADDSEISFRNFLATTDTDPVQEYYCPDFTVKVTKGITTGINNIESEFAAKADGIYTISGVKVDKLVKGVNIVVKDGKATKIVKK